MSIFLHSASFFRFVSIFSCPQDASRILWNHCWLFRNGFERKVSLSKLRLNSREMLLFAVSLFCKRSGHVQFFGPLQWCRGRIPFHGKVQQCSPVWRSRLEVLRWRMRKLPSSLISVQPSKRWVKVGNGNVASSHPAKPKKMIKWKNV